MVCMNSGLVFQAQQTSLQDSEPAQRPFQSHQHLARANAADKHRSLFLIYDPNILDTLQSIDLHPNAHYPVVPFSSTPCLEDN